MDLIMQTKPRFQLPLPARMQIILWKWIPTEGYWMVFWTNMTDEQLNLGEPSEWIPPGDGGEESEYWTIGRWG